MISAFFQSRDFLQEQFNRHRKALRYCGREFLFLPVLYEHSVFDRNHKIAYCPVHKVQSKVWQSKEIQSYM